MCVRKGLYYVYDVCVHLGCSCVLVVVSNLKKKENHWAENNGEIVQWKFKKSRPKNLVKSNINQFHKKKNSE